MNSHSATIPDRIAGYFSFQENGTHFKTEIVAGLSTFMTMSYIIFVQPAILGTTGMDTNAVMVATCVASALATILMGLMANYPVALAPAMGNNGFFRCHCLWCYGIFVASGPESRFHIRCTVPVADHTERLGHYH